MTKSCHFVMERVIQHLVDTTDEDLLKPPITKQVLSKILRNCLTKASKYKNGLFQLHENNAKKIMRDLINVIMKRIPPPGNKFGLVAANNFMKWHIQEQLDNKKLVVIDSEDCREQKIWHLPFEQPQDLFQIKEDSNLFVYKDLPQKMKNNVEVVKTIDDIFTVVKFQNKIAAFKFNHLEEGFQYYFCSSNNKKHIYKEYGTYIIYFNVKKMLYLMSSGIYDPTEYTNCNINILVKFICGTCSDLVSLNRAGIKKNPQMSKFTKSLFESPQSNITSWGDTEVEKINDIPLNMYFGNKVQDEPFDLYFKQGVGKNYSS